MNISTWLTYMMGAIASVLFSLFRELSHSFVSMHGPTFYNNEYKFKDFKSQKEGLDFHWLYIYSTHKVYLILNTIFIIIMIESKTMSAEHETPVDRVVRRVKAMMQNWGLAEGCSFVYAVLIASREPLSAEEIGERTSYAYSSTINYLNTLIRIGLVERVRSIKRNVYMANVNFVELIRTEHEKVMAYLNQLDDTL